MGALHVSLRLTQRHNLCVTGRVEIAFATVPALADDRAAPVNHHRANRHITRRASGSGKRQGASHRPALFVSRGDPRGDTAAFCVVVHPTRL